MQIKHWVRDALYFLESSLHPVPHEINEIDWKLDLTPNKDRTREHLIALANHPGGGHLAFGITRLGDLSGVTATLADQIANTLASIGRDSIEPPLALDHTIVDFQGVAILLVHVPEQATRPAHCRGKGIEESWIRSAGTTRKASRQEIASLMMNSATPKWEDLRASPLTSLDQIKSMLDLGSIATLLERPLPENDGELTTWLMGERLITPEGRGFYITNFGAISAARDLSDFPTIERKIIRLVRYEGTNKTDAIEEVPGRRGYAVGFEGLIKFIVRLLPTSEVIRQSLRANVGMYPELAIRELIANALVHQDFGVVGAGPMIEIFSDRIDVTNPGLLLPSKRVDRLIGTTPESRNEALASSFRRFRICEERGSGFQKIASFVELFGMPPIVFSPLENAFRITLCAPKSFANMSIVERVEACYQHAVLQHLSSKTLTNSSLRERFKINEKKSNQITNLISEAMDRGRIKRKDQSGGKKFAEYIPYWVGSLTNVQ
jgi:predicted HTH transcriptional regulator